LSVLVNNAAGNFIAQTHKLSFGAADTILATTLHGALYCTLAAGRRWIENADKGVVLSILSTSTRTGRAFTVPSAMSKSAVLAMTRILAVEWGPRGVRSVALAPGPFPIPGAWERLYPAERESAASITMKNPLCRVGNPEELTNLAAYLVSDQAGYINGEMIAIDGGQHLRTSGVEDLLTWSDQQWAETRANRAKRS
jgi:NAD(P)-dependent dehydrogenase (short-subunit alcohol dehydrogenase family)